MCSISRSIVKRCEHQAQVFPLRCRSWSCPICSGKRRKAVIRQAVDGNPTRFITLTPNAGSGSEPDEEALNMTRAWRDVVREYRRLWPNREAQYMAVFEATKRGWPHMHILWRGGWIDQRWLSAQMKKRIGAPVVWVSLIRNKKKAAEYCGKYFSKRPIRFGNCKRYWRSFLYLAESETARKKRLKAGCWFYTVDLAYPALQRYFTENGAICRRLKGEGFSAYWLPDEPGSPPSTGPDASWL